MGVSIEKDSSAHEVSLLLELARTVKRLEGVTAVEMDTGFDSLHSMTRLSRDALRCAALATTVNLGAGACESHVSPGPLQMPEP